MLKTYFDKKDADNLGFVKIEDQKQETVGDRRPITLL